MASPVSITGVSVVIIDHARDATVLASVLNELISTVYCLTPLLVRILGVAELSKVIGYSDLALMPAVAVFVVIITDTVTQCF